MARAQLLLNSTEKMTKLARAFTAFKHYGIQRCLVSNGDFTFIVKHLPGHDDAVFMNEKTLQRLVDVDGIFTDLMHMPFDDPDWPIADEIAVLDIRYMAGSKSVYLRRKYSYEKHRDSLFARLRAKSPDTSRRGSIMLLPTCSR